MYSSVQEIKHVATSDTEILLTTLSGAGVLCRFLGSKTLTPKGDSHMKVTGMLVGKLELNP